MAFGRNKDEVFQRVTTVKEEPVKPQKKKKSKTVEEAPAPDTSLWSTVSGDRPQRIESSVPVAKPQPAQAPAEVTDDAPDTQSGVREVGSANMDTRPQIAYDLIDEGEITGGMYSDSGRTVTMAMRVVSYLMYICSPLYFVGKIFEIIGTDAKQITTGFAVSTVVDGIIGAVLLAAGGVLVVALIKILQNLMALQKKKKRRK